MIIHNVTIIEVLRIHITHYENTLVESTRLFDQNFGKIMLYCLIRGHVITLIHVPLSIIATWIVALTNGGKMNI